MYTATVEYEFKPEKAEHGFHLWEEKILKLASKQPGFVRMQLLVSPPKAMAIGTWEDSSYAQKFMQSGVFKDLLKEMDEILINRPVPKIWDQRYFIEV